MGSLSNRHAFITGGGSGIGAAIARALSAEGASVSIAGRRKAQLDEVAASLPKATAIVADVTSESDCAAMMEAARAAHGPIDIVIANAGVADSAPAAKISLELWNKTIGINLTGAFLTARAALADLTRATAGGPRRIVFVSSTAGLKGYPYVAAYCAAKHGVIGLARALATELASSGVTVNAVCPGFTDTPLFGAAIEKVSKLTGLSQSDARTTLARDNADGRLLSPEEVAQAVLRLCLPEANAINGQAIAITGGQT